MGLCVLVVPVLALVPVSLQMSLVVEGTTLLSAGPWTVALSTSVRVVVLSVFPRTHPP